MEWSNCFEVRLDFKMRSVEVGSLYWIGRSYDVRVMCGQEEECSLVILTGQTYDMEDEVYVERRVVVQGSPATMPMLDAG